jgi:hypothetical protein
LALLKKKKNFSLLFYLSRQVIIYGFMDKLDVTSQENTATSRLPISFISFVRNMCRQWSVPNVLYKCRPLNSPPFLFYTQ